MLTPSGIKVTSQYQGDKHTAIVHGPSARTIETDAPKDNQGRGESFSPTDLVAAALSSCLLTVTAMAAEKLGLSFKGATATTYKQMQTDPRRISKLICQVNAPSAIPLEHRQSLEDVARNCPVALSIHPSIALEISIDWNQ